LPDSVPIGGINRLRRQAYHMISKMRHQANGVPEAEPTNIDDFKEGNC